MFAMKKMPKECREKYDNLLHRECLALYTAQAFNIPRVMTCFGPAWCRTSDDDCIILE